jgi:hypothetical protein
MVPSVYCFGCRIPFCSLVRGAGGGGGGGGGDGALESLPEEL